MSLYLRPSLFWDTDVETIDLLKHKSSIIQRIFSRGNLDEYQNVMSYYGKDICKETLINTRYLDQKTLNFCSIIFDTPIEKFRCYIPEQLKAGHLNY